MSAETARKAVDFFLGPDVSGHAPEIQICFFGGEPLLEPDRMQEVLGYATERAAESGRRIQFAVTTSGVVLNSKLEELIERYNVAVLLSLDGDPDTTNADRPLAGGGPSHARVIENLPKFLAASHGRLMLRTTFHPGSLNLLKRVEYLLGLGIPSIALAPVLDAEWEPYEVAVNDEYQELATWFLDRCRQGSAPPLEITWMLLSLWHNYYCGYGRPERPCPVGDNLLAVDPDGNVLPCQRFLYRRQDWLGTLTEPALTKRQPYLEIHSSKLPAECDSCLARPVCGGGCRLVGLNRGLGLQDVYSGFCIPMRAQAAAAYRIYSELAREGLLEKTLGFKSPVGPNFQKLLAGE